MRLTFRLLLLSLPLLSACSLLGTQDPAEEMLTLYVADHTVDCVGEAPQTCLLVREDLAADWTWFYDPIEGFTYEPGFYYTLRVARRHVPDPPADGSSYAYRLVRVLEQEPSTQD